MRKNMKCCIEQPCAECVSSVYGTMPELKGAAVFAKNGSYAIVNRKRIAITPDGQAVTPFEQNGCIWLPMAPVAAGLAHAAVVDTTECTLNFTYRRKKYEFSANAGQMLVNGESVSLGFAPIAASGSLFFPLDFVKSFFHWHQSYVDPMGLVVLSNRKNIFDSVRDEAKIWQLIADTSFVRPTGERIFDDLRRRFGNSNRSKLLATFDDLMAVRKLAKSDKALGGYVAALKEIYGHKSDAFLSPAVSADADAKELKASADALFAFVMLYRVTGDKQYCERAAAEAEAIAALEDWTKGSSLLFSDVCFAMALAYDWCRHVWSEGRKAKLERAMLRMALRPMLEVYGQAEQPWRAGGVHAAALGSAMLALSIALSDIYPQTTYKLSERVLQSLEPCFYAVAPDGGNEASPAAWARCARALGLTVAMLEKACGTDYGFASAPGFAATAYFPIYAESTNGAWNYHNSKAEPLDTSMQYFYARHTDDAVLAWLRRQALLSGRKDVHPFDILYYVPVDDAMIPHLPLDIVYRKAALAIMRSDWNADAAFVGLLGGAESDAGSVLLEMGGERFFEGANTWKVSGAANEKPEATARIVEMRSSDEKAYAVADMSTVDASVVRAKRGVMLTENRSVAVIQDEIAFSEPADFAWSAQTRAEVKISKSGRSAELMKNGKRLGCKLCGVSARFELQAEEGSNLKALTVRIDGKEKCRMAVVCRLLEDGDKATEKVYDVVPMAKWGD